MLGTGVYIVCLCVWGGGPGLVCCPWGTPVQVAFAARLLMMRECTTSWLCSTHRQTGALIDLHASNRRLTQKSWSFRVLVSYSGSCCASCVPHLRCSLEHVDPCCMGCWPVQLAAQMRIPLSRKTGAGSLLRRRTSFTFQCTMNDRAQVVSTPLSASTNPVLFPCVACIDMADECCAGVSLV